ncbi:hypothetical protein AA11237_0322 [Acidocella aminolytica 101 = DSM 11237]|uniref:hypothetical protein n=1 Tax=Acidocella aminolytica TaxID=33998 RepID=UPI001C316800|nr:hypothetical protein [Acidocella aminolytica]GBQ33052.1 hypothetical protein AA11237_0322 [Acidocella aminolytica 101 = DSM 11237]
MRCPLSLRQVEDLLAERGIDLYHETVRLWWNRFAPLFAAEIQRQRCRLRQGPRSAPKKGSDSHLLLAMLMRRLRAPEAGQVLRAHTSVT